MKVVYLKRFFSVVSSNNWMTRMSWIMTDEQLSTSNVYVIPIPSMNLVSTYSSLSMESKLTDVHREPITCSSPRQGLHHRISRRCNSPSGFNAKLTPGVLQGRALISSWEMVLVYPTSPYQGLNEVQPSRALKKTSRAASADTRSLTRKLISPQSLQYIILSPSSHGCLGWSPGDRLPYGILVVECVT